MTEQKIQVSEYVPVEAEGEVKDREASFLLGKEDDEPEEDFSWLEEGWEESEITKETYFVMVNMNRAPFTKGQQCWYSYGSRTNDFLLCNYGFSVRNNHFDSYKFFLQMDVNFQEEQLTLERMLAPKDQEKDVQEIRLKRHQLNLVFLAYLRHSMKKDDSILLTKVSDFEFEMQCVSQYLDTMLWF